MENNTQSRTFEENYRDLEGVIAALEKGEADLETALKLYKQGRELVTRCQKQLETAALTIQRLDTGETSVYTGANE